MTKPRFPLYIPSKGRADSRLTVKALERMGVPYRIIVEEQEYDTYARVINPANILILDPAFQRDYDACMTLTPEQSRGSGPARNFAWEHARSTGAAWHWIMDDNISAFYRANHNREFPCVDGSPFATMEAFVLRYTNVAMAGPNYQMFFTRRDPPPPFTLNTRIYSCNLIRNDLPFRWRGRYNEDTILSLDLLKAGWCTVLFNAFLQKKVATQRLKGGNTDAFYAAEGTLPKSRMLVEQHPDVARVTWRFNRWHHHVDYRPFRVNRLIRDPDAVITPGVNEFGMTLVTKPQPRRRPPR